MKITKDTLKQLIKEEIEQTRPLSEGLGHGVRREVVANLAGVQKHLQKFLQSVQQLSNFVKRAGDENNPNYEQLQYEQAHAVNNLIPALKDLAQYMDDTQQGK